MCNTRLEELLKSMEVKWFQVIGVKGGMNFLHRKHHKSKSRKWRLNQLQDTIQFQELFSFANFYISCLKTYLYGLVVDEV